MIRASKVHGQYHWKQPAADTVVLDFDDRHRRRMAMTGTRGLEFLLDLEHAVALRGGDALVLDDGRLIEVVAAPEPLLEIRGRDPQHLVRLAWHLGNRHLPTQITAKALRIRRDHVIADMVKGLGGKAVEIDAPFDPEGGAYAPAHESGDHDHAHHDHDHHDHGHHHHGHDDHAHHRHDHHDHKHGHDHGKHDHAAHDHGHADHVHDEHCGHDHGHGHGHDHDHGHSHKHDHK
ncbi:MAG: urease accessory protein UreE [Rhodopseudomonas palustris]|uniref:Urease accessory protein UreE n=1 Tax=Rhodopseudomonas palustris TaxID=1076 RepID=A0A933RW12_RHOPL|nr:urease accessory protein UreE [Rhodopseudomonas palustris]